MVLALELLPAVALQVLPAAAAVVQLRMELPTVHVVEEVDAVTVYRFHVVLAPLYE